MAGKSKKVKGKSKATLLLLCLSRLFACYLILSTSLFTFSLAQTSSDNSTRRSANLHQWGAVTLFHGLPSDRVRAVAQGADGAMWFGTDGGLAKYDGRRTQAISAEGLPRGRVLALKLDADGVLWIGTENGATRLVGEKFHPIEETEGLAINAIIAPKSGSSSSVALASEQGLIFECVQRPRNSLAVRTLSDQPLQSADADHPGPLPLTSLALIEDVLYVGTRSRGLLAVERDTFQEVKSRPRAYFIEALEQDAHGHLWFGARAKSDDSGLYKARDPLRPVKVGSGLGKVTALRRGVRGDLWVGTDGRGALRYNDSRVLERFTFEGTAGGLRSNHIFAIFVDREDVVWFGTDKGVCRYDPHALRVETISSDPQSNFVRTLFQTKDGTVFSGTNRGLFFYDKATRSWNPVSELARNVIYAIAEDKEERLLIGSASGLYMSIDSAGEIDSDALFERIETENPERVANDSVRAVTEFQGAIYVASFGRGLERLGIPAQRRLIWSGGSTDNSARKIISLHAGEDGKLWIGTASAGVLIFDGKEVRREQALEKLQGSAVRSIHSNDDWLWFATARGLYAYHSGKLLEIAPGFDARSVVVTAHDGAASPQQQEVWCATNNGGLLRAVVDEQFGPVVSRLDAEQGLPSQNVFAVLPVRSGEEGATSLLIGTNRGVAHYDPGRVAPTLAPSRIISKRLHQPEELRAVGFSLEYPQNSLVLETVAVSSRTFPEKFQYAFVLYDAVGKVIKQKLSHDAQFAMENLAPGKYRVESRAYTVDLVASNPFAFEFHVEGAPFPWVTAALSVLLMLAILALLWGTLQNRRIHRTSAELLNANHQLADARMQLANETESERRRIARDLHDQTLADLRQLILLTDQLPTANGNEGTHNPLAPAAFRAEIESISNEIRRICEDLSPSVLENVGLAAALEWALANAVAHSPSDRKFDYEFACEEGVDERLELATGVRMQIYRIMQEAVSNICRHSAATRVRLSVALTTDQSFVLQLEDNGRDFDPHDRKVKRGRGLMNIRARASMIEADVSWKRRAGGGTVFTLRKTNVCGVR